jgi:hypothetical protein
MVKSIKNIPSAFLGCLPASVSLLFVIFCVRIAAKMVNITEKIKE